MSDEAEGKEGAEGDADEGDAAGVDTSAAGLVWLGSERRGDMLEGVADGVDPEGDVGAVAEEGGVSASGAGAIEVVDGEDGDAEAGECGGDAVEPEVDVAAGTVEKKDSGNGFRWRGGRGVGEVETDGTTTAEEGAKHGSEMRKV